MTAILCPHDHLPLETSGRTARCGQGHAFDWAKEGYLNLLPVQAKQSRDPGDSPEMVQARRAFLGHGFYDPVIDRIGAVIAARHPATILDAGCGEGRYLTRVRQQHRPDSLCYGLDISKHAIKAAAKQDAAITWLVASNRQVPFPDQSMDVVLCAFGFPVWPEFHRVLAPRGGIVMADPGPDHLIELRQALYDTVQRKDPIAHRPAGFQQTHSETVSYAIQPTAAALRALIAMTPHQHRVPPDRIDHVIAQPMSAITVDVVLQVLERT